MTSKTQEVSLRQHRDLFLDVFEQFNAEFLIKAYLRSCTLRLNE